MNLTNYHTSTITIHSNMFLKIINHHDDIQTWVKNYILV